MVKKRILSLSPEWLFDVPWCSGHLNSMTYLLLILTLLLPVQVYSSGFSNSNQWCSSLPFWFLLWENTFNQAIPKENLGRLYRRFFRYCSVSFCGNHSLKISLLSAMPLQSSVAILLYAVLIKLNCVPIVDSILSSLYYMSVFCISKLSATSQSKSMQQRELLNSVSLAIMLVQSSYLFFLCIIVFTYFNLRSIWDCYQMSCLLWDRIWQSN